MGNEFYVHYSAAGYNKHGITNYGEYQPPDFNAIEKDFKSKVHSKINTKPIQDALNDFFKNNNVNPDDPAKIQKEIIQDLIDKFKILPSMIDFTTGRLKQNTEVLHYKEIKSYRSFEKLKENIDSILEYYSSLKKYIEDKGLLRGQEIQDIIDNITNSWEKVKPNTKRKDKIKVYNSIVKDYAKFTENTTNGNIMEIIAEKAFATLDVEQIEAELSKAVLQGTKNTGQQRGNWRINLLNDSRLIEAYNQLKTKRQYYKINGDGYAIQQAKTQLKSDFIVEYSDFDSLTKIGASIKNYSQQSLKEHGLGLQSLTGALSNYLLQYPDLFYHFANIASSKKEGEGVSLKNSDKILDFCRRTIILQALIGGNHGEEEVPAGIFIMNVGGTIYVKTMEELFNSIVMNSSYENLDFGQATPYLYGYSFFNNDWSSIGANDRITKLFFQIAATKAGLKVKPSLALTLF